jgi:hypothetical protein
MRWALVAVVIGVALLHQDPWFFPGLWRSRSLVFGFLPAGLAYHIGYSILASVTMWLLVRFAWPAHLEAVPARQTDGGDARP